MRLGLPLLTLTICLPHVFGTQATFESGFEEEILAASQNAIDCPSCQALLLPLKRLALGGDDRFVKSFTSLCKFRNLADPDVCEGDIARQGPIIAHALRHIDTGGPTSRRLCNALFSLCDPVPTTPYEFPVPEPLLRPRISTQPARGRSPFQVVHISDIHLDQEFTIGSEANCTKYICCRNFESAEESHDVKEPALPYGNRRCDSPSILVDSMLAGIREHVSDPVFTISTGDIVDHVNWLMTESTVEDRLHGFHEQLFEGLSANNAFYGSLGNHDSMPTNEFPRSTSPSNATDFVYDLLGADWKRWIGKGSLHTIHQSGSYAIVHPGTQLKLISLNTQYWYKFNFWLYDSDDFQPDPNGVLSFLVEELHAAETAGQRVWVFGHIAPGVSDALYDQANYFDQIIKRYEHTVAAQFYGHTHYDSFQVGYVDYEERTAENAMSFGLMAPALTPTEGHPAFTVYDVDPDTYDIMDVKVYIANMSEPTYQVKPTWKLLYSARDTYLPLVVGLSSSSSAPSIEPTGEALDARFWHQLTEVFEKNATALDLFRHLTNRMRGPRPRPCVDECKNRTLCALRAMRSEDNCERKSLKDIFPPRFDDHVSAWDEKGSCEGSAFPQIMRRLLLSSQADWTEGGISNLD